VLTICAGRAGDGSAAGKRQDGIGGGAGASDEVEV